MSTAATPDVGLSAMRVLSWPGKEHARWNPYLGHLVAAVEELGVSVETLSVSRALRGGYDVLHMHWPDSFLEATGYSRGWLRLMVLSTMLVWTRVRGVAVVWTVHNLHSHALNSSARRQRVLGRVLGRLVDLQIHLSSATVAEMALVDHPAAGKAFVIVPHGVYEIPAVPNREAAREQLGLTGQHVIAHLGTMTRYKGTLTVARAFVAAGIDRADLVLAGACEDPLLAEELRSIAAADQRIRLEVGRLTEERLATYVSAADWLVYPYRRVLNSGSALRALSQGRGVILPDTATFQDLREEVGQMWVRTYSGELDAEDLKAACLSVTSAGLPDLTRHEWSVVGLQTVDAYRAAVNTRRARRRAR